MFTLFSLDSFKTFSIQHFIVLGLFALIVISTGYFGRKFRHNHELVLLISKVIIGFVIFQEVIDYSNRYINGTIALNIDLPLHICNYVLFISIIAIYRRSEHLFNFCYFNAFSGALIANLTPDLSGVTGDLGVFFFFLHHFLIIINVVWMIFAFNMIPSFKGLLTTIILLNIIAVPVALINALIEKLGFGYANYMYLREAPPVENPLLIGEGGRYILSMEIIAIVVFLLLLLPFSIYRHRINSAHS